MACRKPVPAGESYAIRGVLSWEFSGKGGKLRLVWKHGNISRRVYHAWNGSLWVYHEGTKHFVGMEPQ
jgi:hypothetical protein